MAKRYKDWLAQAESDLEHASFRGILYRKRGQGGYRICRRYSFLRQGQDSLT